jgi:hypothetical protein
MEQDKTIFMDFRLHKNWVCLIKIQLWRIYAGFTWEPAENRSADPAEEMQASQVKYFLA